MQYLLTRSALASSSRLFDSWLTPVHGSQDLFKAPYPNEKHVDRDLVTVDKPPDESKRSTPKFIDPE